MNINYKWSGVFNTRLIEKAVKAKLHNIDGLIYPHIPIVDEIKDEEIDSQGDYI